MQWRKLAFLVVLMLVLLGASVIWSAWHRGKAHAELPKFVPGTPSSAPLR
jgi:hypothetical protein